jgi:hypothetical protein
MAMSLPRHSLGPARKMGSLVASGGLKAPSGVMKRDGLKSSASVPHWVFILAIAHETVRERSERERRVRVSGARRPQGG